MYLPDQDKVLFIPAKLACENKSSFIIRYKESKNLQKSKVHHINEFSDLDRILRDFTLDICNDDDKVQTTTETVSES